MRRGPDDLCPSCGVPVPRGQRGETCPYCRHPFDAPAQDPRVVGYMTPFGHGMCGLVAGSQIGAAVALATGGAELGDPRLVVFPALGGIILALVASAVGKRLLLGARRGYEALMLGMAVAGIAVCCLAVIGVRAPDTLLAGGAIVLVAATPFIWRVLFGRGQV